LIRQMDCLEMFKDLAITVTDDPVLSFFRIPPPDPPHWEAGRGCCSGVSLDPSLTTQYAPHS
jgi:hypothetical protein